MKTITLQLDDYLYRYAQSAARRRGCETAERYLAERLSALLHAEDDEERSRWDDPVFEEDEGGGLRLIDDKE